MPREQVEQNSFSQAGFSTHAVLQEAVGHARKPFPKSEGRPGDAQTSEPQPDESTVPRNSVENRDGLSQGSHDFISGAATVG